MGEDEHHVLVEVEEDEEGVLAVAFAAEKEEEAFEETELGDGVIACAGGLRALLAEDTDSDVRTRDHIDVVGPVSDRQRDHTWLRLAHKLHDFLLLLRGDATGNHRLALICNSHQIVGKLRTLHRHD